MCIIIQLPIYLPSKYETHLFGVGGGNLFSMDSFQSFEISVHLHKPKIEIIYERRYLTPFSKLDLHCKEFNFIIQGVAQGLLNLESKLRTTYTTL